MKNAVPHLYEAILDKVRAKLQENQLTQSAIGEALGIKQSAVSYLLKGKTKLNLEQFLTLAALIGEKPHKLIADADSGIAESRVISREQETVQLRSPLYLLAYVAACRPIKPEMLVTSDYTLTMTREALADLQRVGLLEVKDGAYIQKDLTVNYVSGTREGARRRFQTQGEIHRACQAIWDRNVDNKPYRARRFNYFNVAYLTPSQTREILDHLWRAYERVTFFEKENAAAGYQAPSERYDLWQMHMMMMTPLEDK